MHQVQSVTGLQNAAEQMEMGRVLRADKASLALTACSCPLNNPWAHIGTSTGLHVCSFFAAIMRSSTKLDARS